MRARVGLSEARRKEQRGTKSGEETAVLLLDGLGVDDGERTVSVVTGGK